MKEKINKRIYKQTNKEGKRENNNNKITQRDHKQLP